MMDQARELYARDQYRRYSRWADSADRRAAEPGHVRRRKAAGRHERDGPLGERRFIMAGRRGAQPAAPRPFVLDVEREILRSSDPKAIAQSLKRAADDSQHRKANPYNSAMSMLSLYINRAGDTLDPGQRAVLEAAKDELRALYGRPVKA